MVTVNWKMSFNEAAVIKRALEHYIGHLKAEYQEVSDVERSTLAEEMSIASDVLMKAKS
jgi:hypothetical protein